MDNWQLVDKGGMFQWYENGKPVGPVFGSPTGARNWKNDAERQVPVEPHVEAAQERLEHFREGLGAPIENPIPQTTAPTANEQINEVIENLQKPDTVKDVAKKRKAPTKRKPEPEPQVSGPQTVQEYIDAQIKGSVPNTPEWEQFYLNNSEEIERQLLSRHKATAPKPEPSVSSAVPEAPKPVPEVQPRAPVIQPKPPAKPKTTPRNVVSQAQAELSSPPSIRPFLKESIENLKSIEKEKLFLWGAVGGSLGLAALWLANHHKPKFDRVSDKSFRRPQTSGEEEAIKSSTLSASILSGIAVTALGSKGMMGDRLSPFLRRNLFIGGSFALNTATDIAIGHDPAIALMSGAGAAVAGYFATGAGQKWSGQGLKMVQEYIAQNGRQGTVARLYSLIEKAKTSHPYLDKLLSSSNMGVLAGVAAIPVAHGIIRRLLLHFSAKSQIPTEPLKNVREAPNQAGFENQRDDGDWAVNASVPKATMRVSGRLRSHYDHHSALSSIR